MATDDETMTAYYAARAAEYDRIYEKPERQDDLRQLRQTLPRRFHGRRVIEVAAGTGYWTRLIAHAAASVVAIDAARETLAVAASRVGPNVELVAGDAYDLPADRGLFDAAFAGFWFSHVPRARQREFLSGLGRLLRPGSPVVLLDNRFVDGSSTPIAATDAAGDTWQDRVLADGTTHRVLKNFPDEAEMRAAVEGLGDHAEWQALEYYWVFRYAARAPA